MIDALRLWAIAEAVGLLALPVAGAFFARLPGGGLALARPLGLLLATYPVWLLASLHILPYTLGSAWLGPGVLAVLAVGVGLYRRSTGGSPLAGLGSRENRQLWLTGELLFTGAFAFSALLRGFAPDVWGTEKPMDMAFINAINRSLWMPPHDPWLSGATINYYYFGHFVVAWLIRSSSVAPWAGFNLGVACFFALSVLAVYGVASALYAAARRHADAPAMSPVVPGLIAAAFAVLLGNLAGALELLQQPGPPLRFDWWSPSRVIADTINEFPFFSFLLADLHAHMLAAPFGLTALAFACQLALSGPRNLTMNGQAQFTKPRERGWVPRLLRRWRPANARAVAHPAPFRVLGNLSLTIHGQARPLPPAAGPVATATIPAPADTPTVALGSRTIPFIPVAGELLLAGLLAGSLYALNGWDYPTELGIGFLCLLLWASRREVAAVRPAPLALWAGAWLLISLVLFLPFYLHFKAPEGGLGVVRQHATLVQYLHNYLLIYGLFVWVIGAAFLRRLGRSTLPRRYLIWGGVAALALLALLAPVHLDGLALLLAACAFALSASADDALPQPARLWWLVVGVAIGLATIGEVVYLRDAFAQTPDYRMNTVFKFGYQAWFLLAVTAGCGAVWARRWLKTSTFPFWLAGLLFLVVCAGIYTVAGSYAREGGFRSSPTLDGLQWLQAQAPGDAAAIRWLDRHVQGAPTIVEAVGPDYDPAGHARFSTFTGLPTVDEWPGHEAQWAHDQGTREQDVKTLYSTTDSDLARSLLAHYGIRYVVVGSLERADFRPAGLAKFTQLGRLVFAADGTMIYQVGS